MEISRTPFQKLIATQSKKNDSKEITINMFKAGKSIAEIAAERGFAASTIESHLIMYIEIGELDIKDFVTQNYIDAIEDFLSQNPTAGLNDVKAALPDQITYNEINLLLLIIV
jgi:uncharacterized protein YpbB